MIRGENNITENQWHDNGVYSYRKRSDDSTLVT